MSRNAYVLLVLTALLWAGNGIAGALAVGHVSPMVLTLLRWTASMLLALAIGYRHFARDWPAVRASLPTLLVLGGIGFSLFNGATYMAVIHTSVINVAIEQAALPMFILLANFLFFAVRVAFFQVVGFVLTLAGVAVTAAHGDLSRLLELQFNIGDGLVMFACALYAAYTIGLRYKPDIHWTSLMIVMSAGAVITTIPLLAAEIAFGAARMPDARGWGIVAYTAIFPSLVAQTFFMKGVELIGGNRAGLFINLVPIMGTLLAIVLLGEFFFAYHAIALALVLSGIALAEYAARRRAALAQMAPPLHSRT